MTTISLRVLNYHSSHQDLEFKFTFHEYTYAVKKIEVALSSKFSYQTLAISKVLTETLAQQLFDILSSKYHISNDESTEEFSRSGNKLFNMLKLLKAEFNTERFEKKNIFELIQSNDVEDRDQILRNIKEKWESCSSEQLSDFLIEQQADEHLIGEVRELEHNG